MNETNQSAAERFRLAAEILASGDTHYQFKSIDGGWKDLRVSANLLGCELQQGREFRRIPWALTDELPGFRKLREGERWHREDFTREMLPKGWRPLLLGEEQLKDDEFYSAMIGQWIKCSCFGQGSARNSVALHGRTRRPLPEPASEPEWVELGPVDVFPCSAFRHPNWGPGIHITPSLVYRDGVSWTRCDNGSVATPEIVTFHELKGNGWQINRSIPLTGKWDPTAWEPCKKPKS